MNQTNGKDALMKALTRGMGVQAALDAAYRAWGNPICLFDNAYKLLASTENTVNDDPLWNELLEKGSFSHETVRFFKNRQMIESVVEAESVTMLVSEQLPYDRIVGKLFDDHRVLIGDIVIVGCYRLLEPEDLRRVEAFCDFLGEEVQSSVFYPCIGRLFPEDFISALIEERVQKSEPPNEAVEKQMNGLYAGLKVYLYVAVVDIAEFDRSLAHLEYFRSMFEKIQSEYKYFIYLNNVLMLISAERPFIKAEQDMCGLLPFLAQNKLHTGISAAFQNLYDLRRHYQQAISALNHGMQTDDGPPVYLYDDFRADHFLRLINRREDLYMLCGPTVPMIREYDEEHHTAYLNTLHHFLVSGMNVRLAAARAHKDPDSLHGELTRIFSLFGIDGGSGDQLLNLFLSIKVSALL